MRYRSLSDLEAEAHVTIPVPVPMTIPERRLRWITALEARGQERLATLPSVEYMSPIERTRIRRENSPLAVAFANPELRAAGLRDDTYGEALRFFGFSHGGLHRLTCRCQFGAFVSADRVARRLRAMTQSPLAKLEPVFARWGSALRGLMS